MDNSAKVILVSGLLVAMCGQVGLSDQQLLGRLQADLAERLGIEPGGIRILSQHMVTWPDSAIGLPMPGRAYTMALQEGSIVVLTDGQERFLYTTGRGVFAFGGPLDLWSYALLVLSRPPGDPNLNGQLIALSVAGTNPTAVVDQVQRFAAGVDGPVFFTRIGPSGQTLYRLDPGSGPPQQLFEAYLFGQLAVSDSGVLAVPFRQGPSGPWVVRFVNPSGRFFDVNAPGDVVRTWWPDESLAIEVKDRSGNGMFKITPGQSQGWMQWRSEDKDRWSILLDKSLSLEIQTWQQDYRTQVHLSHFLGGSVSSCSIPDLYARGFVHVMHYLLIWGACRSGRTSVVMVRHPDRVIMRFELDGQTDIAVARSRLDVHPAIRKVLRPRP